MRLIDMHVHSTYSDGTATPEQIVKMAKNRRLFMIALTDHDTTSGLNIFSKACRREKINGLCGIELSAEADFVLHILGYRINPQDEMLNKRLKEVREQRNRRNEEMCEKLQKMGMDITIGEVREISGGEVVARPHIATLLQRKGYVSTRREAFLKYIGDTGCAFVKRERISPEECIQLIRNAGGLPVMAHPYQTQLDLEELDKVIGKLKTYGLWGIETLYTGYMSEQIFNLGKIAMKYSLAETAGSDFHGANKPGVEIGIPVTDTFLPWARLGMIQ